MVIPIAKQGPSLFGFHAVGVRLKIAPQSIKQVYVDAQRHDARMRTMMERLQLAGVSITPTEAPHLLRLCGSNHHQGVVAMVEPLAQSHSLDEILDRIQATPLLLVLDGVTDPHNLGACLRVADAVGVHAVIAPKDNAAGINATVAKVASGAAETVPYLMVTNLSRTLKELKERSIVCLGLAEEANDDCYSTDLKQAAALVMGAEGKGLRHLTKKTCDALIRIPMQGAVESLNVSVASGIVLYEAWRQRKNAAS